MPLPAPAPGLVVRYAYLWRDEAPRGRDEGIKDRPCAVVLAVVTAEGGTRVVLAPITHATPRAELRAIALPRRTAERLGLDDRPQWILTHEVNVFAWPGPDLRPIDPRRPDRGFAYGYLPKALTDRLIAAVREHQSAGALRLVGRDETS